MVQTTKVVTGKVRLSFVHVFEPFSPSPDQDPKYSCMILIDKSDTRTLGALRAAAQAAAENGKSRVFGGSVPKNLKSTLRDADEEWDLDKNPEMAGKMFMTVNSKTKPGIVDRDVQPILDSTEVYSGCYARVSVNAFAYNTSGNKGISFGLNHIMKLDDGEHLDGRTSAEQDFAEFAEESEVAGVI